MTFKIISAGWNCAEFIPRTLASVLEQTNQDWQIMIVDDASTDRKQAAVLQDWMVAREREGDGRWLCRMNSTNLGTPRNQYEGILAMEPMDDDIIIFLDLDGDRLAHPEVLNHLLEYYSDETLLTYGQYEPIPDKGTHSLAQPYPKKVVRERTYRRNPSGFNHLRTMKGKLFNAIPIDQFYWTGKPGQWYKHGTDYIFMICGLELANGRYKCIEEVLCLYNHANPNADYLVKGKDSTKCIQDFLAKPPLKPLVKFTLPSGTTNLNPVVSPIPKPRPVKKPVKQKVVENVEPVRYMTAEERRVVLKQYGIKYGLRSFVETGTNTGETPWTLQHHFDELFTIELEPTLYKRAKERFRRVGKVTCLHGDSTDVLPEVLRRLQQPALFWLDGHHSGPGTAHGKLDTPVVQELEILFADGRRHVILVDDARIFDGQPEHNDEPHYHDYPTVEWVAELAAKHDFDCELKDDIIRITPA